MAGASWSAADDRYLWSQMGHLPRTSGGNLQTNRDVNALVSRLALHFGGRTDGSIRSRLKHLHDPEHSAHKRLIPEHSAHKCLNPEHTAPKRLHFEQKHSAQKCLNLEHTAHKRLIPEHSAHKRPNPEHSAHKHLTGDPNPSKKAKVDAAATSMEMQQTSASLERQMAAVRYIDSEGRQCCAYCRRLACSTTCPLQQCPLGDRSGGGFTRCKGNTLRGERCKVTSESPRHCGSSTLQQGGQYCEKHNTQTATTGLLIPSHIDRLIQAALQSDEDLNSVDNAPADKEIA